METVATRTIPTTPLYVIDGVTPATQDKRCSDFWSARTMRRPTVLMRATTSQGLLPRRYYCVLRLVSGRQLFASTAGRKRRYNITLYGFSIMKESLEKAVFPGFTAQVETGTRTRCAVSLHHLPVQKQSPTRFCKASKRDCDSFNRTRCATIKERWLCHL